MDDLRRIDMNLLLTLHALLTEKHVTRAALRLHRSQPAVSHSLSQLRQIFNDPLLVRREAGLTLTTRAQALLGPLEQALDQLNELIQAPQFDPRHSTRHFRLALSDYGTNAVLPTLMQHLRTQAPGISLAVSHAGREMMLAQLIDGEIDLGLGVFPERPSEVHTPSLKNSLPVWPTAPRCRKTVRCRLRHGWNGHMFWSRCIPILPMKLTARWLQAA